MYGAKSALAGVMLELNAKVDIWMIGVFLSDKLVGIYTFAAMVAEGVYQLLVVLQTLLRFSSMLRSQVLHRPGSPRKSWGEASTRSTPVVMGTSSIPTRPMSW